MSSRASRAIIACLFAWLFVLSGPARADEPRPLYVQITEAPGNTYDLTWRMPPNFAAEDAPGLLLPPDCAAVGQTSLQSDSTGHWQRQTVRCAAPLAGRAIRTSYPDGNPGLGTIFKNISLSGEADISLALPHERTLALPAPGTRPNSVFLQYMRLGIEHIWIGFDHLLFAACLIWIAGTLRRILITITGFTVAHSVTLTLASLDLVRVPIAAVEAIIALSIVFLAVELAKGPRDTVTWRHPVAVASVFGLLHGFGFASVLAEIGLPQDDLVAALFSFNLGIEIGQAIFVVVIVGAMALIRTSLLALSRHTAHWRLASQSSPLPRLCVAYGVGVLASLWMLQRIVGA
jgi:hypothetical protein